MRPRPRSWSRTGFMIWPCGCSASPAWRARPTRGPAAGAGRADGEARVDILIIAGIAALIVIGLPIAAAGYFAARQAWHCGRLYVTALAAALGIPDPATAVLAE